MSGSEAPTGHLVEIWRYPVTGLMGERLQRVRLDAGLDRDRTVGPWDVDAARFLAVEDHPQLRLAQARTEGDGLLVRLPDGTEVVVGAPSAEAAFSAWLDRRVELRPVGDGHGGVAAPVRVLSLSSIAALAREHPSGQWDARRFRPHLLVVVPGVDFGEDDWVGSQVEAGVGRIEVDEPIGCSERWGLRQVGLAADPAIVSTVRAAHGGTVGVSGRVVRAGVVELGDAIGPVGR